ncbi:LPS export ABC transporter periplasmic protein LptC [Leptothoe kymatousa]|uniref:LPS export ABC transporter periplasmic protein LptC n=1 Tax=Leptothoe kymatousa TAU-MAC 1615 TaxID=2364775 RepID=A0ABS5Y0X8_9CYAN|nr:LPS export ABC transporter periplasmic protein LptC [Leptothoe kymatousa]MBT9311456.1 LPS export ABC transporter periplasmic protein LptC [Leptothoe kymatousa TAU-MAC 1615]
MSKWYRFTIIAALIAVIVVAVRTCQSSGDTLESIQNQEPTEQTEPELTLKDVTLEQPGENGGLLWRVKAKEATYSPDRRLASLKSPEGELFQDGKVIYKVKADQGEIREDGKSIFLQGNIVATSPDEDIVLKGKSLEWIPEDDLLMVKDSIVGEHPQLSATAQEARLFNKTKRLELFGGVVANTTEEPWMGFKSDKLVFLLDENKLQTDVPVQMERYVAKKDKTVTDRLVGNQGEFDLTKQQALLQQQVQMNALKLPLQANSDEALWEVADGIVVLKQSVKIEHPKRKLTANAMQGRLNLDSQMLLLDGKVQAVSKDRQSLLLADQLTWNIQTQDVDGRGNVSYSQQDPAATVNGDRAVGNLERQTVVVTGNNVVTEIVPLGVE